MEAVSDGARTFVRARDAMLLVLGLTFEWQKPAPATGRDAQTLRASPCRQCRAP